MDPFAIMGQLTIRNDYWVRISLLLLIINSRKKKLHTIRVFILSVYNINTILYVLILHLPLFFGLPGKYFEKNYIRFSFCFNENLNIEIENNSPVKSSVTSSV